MIIIIDYFKKLPEELQNFIMDYGAFNCCVVKLRKDCKKTLFKEHGEDSYSEEDISIIDSFIDGKWHIAHESNGDYFLAGDDNLVFSKKCFSSIKDDFPHKEFLKTYNIQ